MEKVLRVEDGKYISGEVIGAEADLMTLLWENPDPTTTFAPQTISMDLSKYDELNINFSWSTNTDTNFSQIVCIDNIQHSLFASVASSTAEYGTSSILRHLTANNSGITFTNAAEGHTSQARTAGNAFCIPLKIYGIKNKIQTVAKNVATTADKCMLSDGETSVEEALSEKYVYSYDECVVGKWVDGKTLYQKTVKFHTAAKSTDGYTGETIVLLNFPANVISFDGFLDSRVGGGQYTMPLNWPWFIGSDARTLLGAYVATRTNDTVLSILTNRTIEGDQDGYITIRYTKNT